jgi:beta-glucosidase
VNANDTFTVRADATNKGTSVATTVPQLYVGTPFEPASAQRPVKRLEGFKRITLNPGQTKTVSFTVKAAQLAFFDEAANKYVVDPGKYSLQVGSSSANADIALRGSVKISGKIAQTPTVVDAKPIESGDLARHVAQRVMFDVNTTIDPQLTVSTNDESVYGYVTEGQSTPLPHGLKVSYSSDRPSVVSVGSDNTLTAVGSGIATITATVRYNGGTASTSFTVDVAPLQITSDPSAAFAVGMQGSFTVTTNSSPTATLSESGRLPHGITFHDNGDGTATISGTAPSTTGTFPITITARNGVSPTVKQTFLLYIGTPAAIRSANSANFYVGSAGSFTVTTTGYPTAKISESGALPNGITFTDNGDGTATISGTPAAGSRGGYPITITATNGVNPPATQSFTLTVLDQAPTSTTAVLAGSTVWVINYGGNTFRIPVANITVHLFTAGTTTDAVAPVSSASNGSYEFDNVPPGDYQVEFVDPNHTYVTQWFNGTDAGAPDQSGASTVTLTAGQARVGVNASLVRAS